MTDLVMNNSLSSKGISGEDGVEYVKMKDG